MSDIQSQLPVKINDGTNLANVTSANALKVDLSATTANATAIKVDNSAVTQPVSGAVSISNFPTTQPISGSVSVSNFPTTQPVSISGTISTTQGETASGIVNLSGSVNNVAYNASGTITYTVTNGKTLYLKQIHAAASGGPCKVVTNYGTNNPNNQTQILTSFFSTANPFYDITFAQPIAISSGVAVNVIITNMAGITQDVYASLFGHEQ